MYLNVASDNIYQKIAIYIFYCLHSIVNKHCNLPYYLLIYLLTSIIIGGADVYAAVIRPGRTVQPEAEATATGRL